MRHFSALAALELDDLPAGVVAVDALAKKAPIALLRCGTITRGRFLIVLGGTPAAVEEAFLEALSAGAGAVADQVLLADAEPRLVEAVLHARRAPGDGAHAVLETPTVSSLVLACERALKGTPVELVELRPGDSGLGGKGLAVLRGDLHDVEAAVEIAGAALAERGRELSTRLVAAPHEALLRALAGATAYAASPTLELDGEVG